MSTERKNTTTVDCEVEGSSVSKPSSGSKDVLQEIGKNNENPGVTEISNKGENSRFSTKSVDENKSTLHADLTDSLTLKFKNMALPSKILSEVTLDGIVKYIQDKPCKNIITMVGAGISTAAGIPDFRSPITGIYHNLQKYNLPYMQAIFELDYFLKNPEPFYKLASDLLPGDYKPTTSHNFIRLLQEKGLLLRHYTQNIDNLDRMAGISEEKLVEAHGTFYRSHCLGADCKKEYDFEWLRERIFNKRVPRCTECDSIVKPDIIFFGESLPERFYEHISTDFKDCDLLIIMGSSLEVEPFASLALRINKSCPRLMINGTKVGSNINFQFGNKNLQRDVLFIGECDVGCQMLAEKLGWGEDLLKLSE